MKLIFPKSSFTHDSNYWMISLLLSQPTRFFNIFSPSLLLSMESERATCWASSGQPRSTHQTDNRGGLTPLSLTLCKVTHRTVTSERQQRCGGQSGEVMFNQPTNVLNETSEPTYTSHMSSQITSASWRQTNCCRTERLWVARAWMARVYSS